ncbi:MAG TPA: cellulase family glycosylhydrolase, partial [Candidatus Bathyarchaeia archaeon]|nr:cellulase family glycosylhydrolase [Candidatus Bathyarchaeia archaeon]
MLVRRLLILACLLAAACSDGAHSPAATLPALTVRDGRFVDALGREVVLRGANARVPGIFDVTFDDGRAPLEPLPDMVEADAAAMATLGFSVLRLPINWSGLEPSQGEVAPAYLDRVQAIVDLMARHGIYTLVDFHQDAFSKEFGEDGAPAWVCAQLLGDDGFPRLGGPLDDLAARRLAPYTIQAFHDFFASRTDVQDELAGAAAAVAHRFAGDPHVVGYELFNEPFLVYAGVADAEDRLREFHERVARAIRQESATQVVFFEPDTSRNQADRAPIPAAPFADPHVAYAPHIYTTVFSGNSSPNFASGNPADLAPSMVAAAAEAAAWGGPLFVGEFGIDPSAPNANPWIRDELDLQDRFLASSTFWLWEEVSQGRWGVYEGDNAASGERTGRLLELARAYPRAVAGHIEAIRFDADS